jgi:hypothetical protein
VDVSRGQAMHAPSPEKSLKKSAAHAVQLSPFVPENPGLHRHSVRFLDPARLVVEAGQARHCSSLPMVDLYMLGGHAVHPPASAVEPLKPGAHSHAEMLTLPWSDVEPLGQTPHAYTYPDPDDGE